MSPWQGNRTGAVRAKPGLRWVYRLGYLRGRESARLAAAVSDEASSRSLTRLTKSRLVLCRHGSPIIVTLKNSQTTRSRRSLRLNAVRARSLSLVVLVLCCASIAHGQSPTANVGSATEDAPSRAAEIDAFIAASKLTSAATLARTVVDEGAEATLPIARLAQAFEKVGKLEQAAEFYRLSLRASEKQGGSTQLAAKKVNLIRLAACSSLLQTKQVAEAFEVLMPLLAQDGTGDQEGTQRSMAVKLCLRIGSAAFALQDNHTAYKAYTLAGANSDGDARALPALGAAWALALMGDRPEEAARHLARFVQEFPSHADAPRAARACAECLQQAGRKDDASRMRADLLSRWPDSDSAFQMVQNRANNHALDQVPEEIEAWLLSEAASARFDLLDARRIQWGVIAAAGADDDDSFDRFTRRLAAMDKSGQFTSDLLQALIASKKQSLAERIAASFIAPTAELAITKGAREAACRWAGRQQHWAMLALASETESIDNPSPSRTASVERLFAEALMQTGRPADARPWWNHLIQQRNVNDFATLLRCAETETSTGEDAQLAQRRVDAARQAAGEDVFHLSLVSLLDAELAIRRIEFDQARGHLERVVRATDTDASLRGRAQWLIGETFYLQQNFPSAIEAYRHVEGIDPGGAFAAVSLVQAGKSFEQLGRTREAAVCYLGLVNRFANSPHAALARRRLAAIAPENVPNQQQSDPILIR